MSGTTSDQLKLLRSMGAEVSILYVEDEAVLREEMALYLGKIFKDIRIYPDGEQGLQGYNERPADIIITDILTPKLNGIEMLQAIKEISPFQEMIITSAYTESTYFIDAIKLGIDAYIIKPIDHAQIIEVLYKTVLKIHQARENEEYRRHLETLVATKVEEFKELEEEKILNYEKTLLGLIKMIERRDSYTAGHSQRVALYSKMIAEKMGYPRDECELIYRAGILHDIGKIATPDTILLKPGKLDEIERELIQVHVNVGVEMLREIPMFFQMSKIIAEHHERYDGKGYPAGLAGDEIHELSRVMIVADAFDAMTTNRIYKPRKTVSEALDEIDFFSGKQFDPNIVAYAREALQNVEIEENISQLPSNALEEERFAYFYKDGVSGLYNQRYLDVVLLKNSYSRFYKCLNIISLHKFDEYNDKYGWDKGDELLKDVAQLLKERFIGCLLFRIHANDFIVIAQEHVELPSNTDERISFLIEERVSCSHFHFDIEKDKIVTIKELEKRMRDERYRRKQISI